MPSVAKKERRKRRINQCANAALSYGAAVASKSTVLTDYCSHFNSRHNQEMFFKINNNGDNFQYNLSCKVKESIKALLWGVGREE